MISKSTFSFFSRCLQEGNSSVYIIRHQFIRYASLKQKEYNQFNLVLIC